MALFLFPYLCSMISDKITLKQVNKFIPNTLMEHLGMEFTAIGPDYLTATMPVNKNVHQPMGILHGGASVALAETVGSAASNLIIDHKVEYCVGLDINANHIRSVKEGIVTGTAKAIHLGRKTHIWQIEIVNEEGKLVCTSRLTMAVIKK